MGSFSRRKQTQKFKGPFKWLRLVLLDFSLDKSLERMLGPFEHVCDFVESAELTKVESLSNGSRIKFELDQTFARLQPAWQALEGETGKGDSREARKASAQREVGGGGGALNSSSASLISPIPLPLLAPATQASPPSI